MRFRASISWLLCLATLALGCESVVQDEPITPGDAAVAGDVSEVPVDVQEAPADIAANDVEPGLPELPDVGPGSTDIGGIADVPMDTGPANEKCDCDTATEVIFLKDQSHATCATPAPGSYREVCKESFTKVFKSGQTFGVKGCKFQVECPRS